MEPARPDGYYLDIKRRFLAEGRRFAIISVHAEADAGQSVSTESPQRGAKLIVDESGELYGSTGSDMLDRELRDLAFSRLVSPSGSTVSVPWPPAVSCEIVEPPPRLIIFGTNSVGLAIARTAENLEFRCLLIENDTDETALENLRIDVNTYIAVTHPRTFLRAIEFCLVRPHAYLGVVGSREKIEDLKRNLAARGISPDLSRRMHGPIGFDIGARTPEEIAIAALAQILAAKNGTLGE